MNFGQRPDLKLLSPVHHRSAETQRALVRLKVSEARVRSRVNLGILSVGQRPACHRGLRSHFQHMKAKFTYWKESDGKYLGYLHSYPDHWTQGEDLEDLKDHLRDLHETFSAEEIPGIKQVAELEVA